MSNYQSTFYDISSLSNKDKKNIIKNSLTYSYSFKINKYKEFGREWLRDFTIKDMLEYIVDNNHVNFCIINRPNYIPIEVSENILNYLQIGFSTIQCKKAVRNEYDVYLSILCDISYLDKLIKKYKLKER
jgi:hypothetical protein